MRFVTADISSDDMQIEEENDLSSSIKIKSLWVRPAFDPWPMFSTRAALSRNPSLSKIVSTAKPGLTTADEQVNR